MKTLAALLLTLAALPAPAACFAHPDTGVWYCSSAAECAPAGWNPSTQACSAAAPSCSGSEAGTYTPAIAAPLNLYQVTPRKAFWTRTGAVVSVAGTVDFLPNGAGPAEFQLTPPIGTTFATIYDASGVMAARSEDAVGVQAAPGGGVRFLYFGSGQYVNESGRYSYSYRISECP